MDTTSAQKKTWTTGEVARMLQLSKPTLIRWIRLGFLPEPEVVQVGRVRLRAWQRDDIGRALNHRNSYYWWTRSEIERGKNDGGTQTGAERPSPSGDEQAGGAQPSDNTRA
jgi:predicted DNA-binding transcriptional regulator AlpA